MYTIYSALGAVPLHTLRNLKRLTYTSDSLDPFLRYPVGQLQTITSSSGLIAVALNGFYNAKDKYLCRALDGILVRDVFSSLKSVFIPRGGPFLLFPKLYSAGLLKATWGDRRKEYV